MKKSRATPPPTPAASSNTDPGLQIIATISKANSPLEVTSNLNLPKRHKKMSSIDGALYSGAPESRKFLDHAKKVLQENKTENSIIDSQIFENLVPLSPSYAKSQFFGEKILSKNDSVFQNAATVSAAQSKYQKLMNSDSSSIASDSSSSEDINLSSTSDQSVEGSPISNNSLSPVDEQKQIKSANSSTTDTSIKNEVVDLGNKEERTSKNEKSVDDNPAPVKRPQYARLVQRKLNLKNSINRSQDFMGKIPNNNQTDSDVIRKKNTTDTKEQRVGNSQLIQSNKSQSGSNSPKEQVLNKTTSSPFFSIRRHNSDLGLTRKLNSKKISPPMPLESILVNGLPRERPNPKSVHFRPEEGDIVPPNAHIFDVQNAINEYNAKIIQRRKLLLIQQILIQQIRDMNAAERQAFNQSSPYKAADTSNLKPRRQYAREDYDTHQIRYKPSFDSRRSKSPVPQNGKIATSKRYRSPPPKKIDVAANNPDVKTTQSRERAEIRSLFEYCDPMK